MKYFKVLWVEKEIKIETADTLDGSSAVFFVDRSSAEVWRPVIENNTFYGEFKKHSPNFPLLRRLEEIWKKFGDGTIVAVTKDGDGLPIPVQNFNKKAFGRFLASKGIKIKDLNNYLTFSYKIGVNPLPAIRKLLREGGFENAQVSFGIWGSGHFLSINDGGPSIICWVRMDENKIEEAWLEINN